MTAGSATGAVPELEALSTCLVHVVMHGIESLSAVALLLHRAGRSVGDVGDLDFIDAAGPRA